MKTIGTVTEKHRVDKSNTEKRVSRAASKTKLPLTRTKAKARDIAERRRAELLEAIPDGVLIVNTEGKIVIANRQGEALFGYEADELIGKSVEMLMPERFRQNHTSLREKYFAAPRSRQMGAPGPALLGRRRDGSEFPIDVSLNALEIDGGLATIAVIRDVTESKQVEEALQASTESQANLLKNINGAVYRSRNDKYWTVEYISEGCAALTGYQPDELIESRLISLGSLIHPEDADPVWEKCQINLAMHKACSNEYRIFHRHGGIRWVWDQAQGIYSDTGELIYVEGLLTDITERKLAETAIQESEKRYKEVVDNASDIIYSTDLEGKITHANPTALRVIGYSFEELTKLSWLDIILPEYQRKVRKISIRQFLGKSPAVYIEFPILTASRDVRWLGQNASLIWEGRRIVGFHVIARDVTDRKRTEDALRNAEEKYRALVEHLPLVVYISELGSNGVWSYVSPHLEGLLGFTAEEWMADPTLWYRQVHPEDRDRQEMLEEEAFARGEPFESEYRIFTKDGREIWLRDSGHTLILEAGKAPVVQGVIVDVTERKRAEETLRRSEEKYRNLIDAMSEGLGVQDHNGLITFLNKRACEMLGYELEELIGKPVTFLFDEENQKILREQMTRQQKGVDKSFEIAWLRKDGGKIDTIIAPRPRFDDTGGFVESVAVFTDITERKRVEEALRESQSRLSLFFNQSLDGFFFSMLDEPKEWSDSVDKEKVLDYVLVNQHITEVNDAMLEQYGATRENFLGRTPANFFAHDLEQARRFRRKLFDTGRLHLETEERKDDDSLIWIEGDYVCMYDAQHRITGIFGIQRDITARKQGELDLKRNADEFASLYEITKDLSQVLEVPRLLEGIVERTNTLLESSGGFIYLYDQTQDDLVLAVTTNMNIPIGTRLKIGEGMAGKVALTREPMIVEDYHNWRDRAQVYEDQAFRSIVEVPMISGGELIGVLGAEVYDDSSRMFDGKDTRLLSLFAGYAASAVRNARLYLFSQREVAERREAEQALSESESVYRRAIEVAGAVPYYESYYDHGARINYEFIGEGIRQITGYGPEEFNATLWDSLVLDVHLVEDLSGYSLDEAIQRVRSGATSIWKCEHRIRHRNGEIRWVFEAAVELRDEEGVSHGSIGMYQDITDRKQAEQTLHQSEQRYRALFEEVPIAIWEEDFSDIKKHLDALRRQGVADFREYFESHPEAVAACSAMIRVLNVNNTAMRMFQAESKEDLLQETNQGVSLGEQEHNHEDFIAIAEGRNSNSWEGADETLTGQPIEISLSWSVVPGYEDDYSRIIVTTIDITERKRAEQTLQEAEAKYRALVEQIPAAVYVWELGEAGRCHYISPRVETMLGFSTQEWLNDRDLFFRQVHPDDRALVLAAENHSRDTGEPLRSEFRMLTREGREIWVRDESLILQGNTSQPRLNQGLLSDITERKRIEAERERLSNILEASLNEIYIFSANTLKFQYVNLGAQRNLGYSFEQLETLTPLDIKPEFTEASFHEKLAPLFQHERETVAFETVHRRKNGSLYPVEVHLQLVEHHREQVFLAIINDITDRKQAEQAMRESNQRFHQLADNIEEVFWITDPQTKKDLYISPAYERIWGRSPEVQFQNLDAFTESITPEDRERVQTALIKQEHGEKTEVEYRITRPDGSERWIWDRAFPIFDETGRVNFVTGIAADITERKRAEKETLRHLIELEALHENGLAINRLLEPGEIGRKIIETFERYLSWHHVTIRLRRGESEDLDLIAFTVSHLKEEEEKQEEERNFNSLISKMGQGLSGWVVQTGVPIRSGNVDTYPQYVNTHEGIRSGMYMPLKIGDRIMGCISVESKLADAFSVQDERLLSTLANQAAVAFENARLFQTAQQELSERMRAEELLERERNSLAQRVEERTADFSRANENLARALRVKDEFLANMSHELRTPLNAILGLSESLGEQIAGSLNDKQQKYVTTISESGHHLLALINDILDLAKIEAGQITLDVTKVDIQSVCQASLRMIKQLAQKKNQKIKLEIDNEFGLIWADERRLKQMIVNLLSNAVKFTPENGRIGLEVHGDRGENKVLITVWDNGIGIEGRDFSKLFQPFVQLDAGLARESSGTGLGLALVAQMARLHGGSVSVDSMPGEGSRFTLAIPWQPALSADTLERMKVTGRFRAVKLNAERQRTILLIEDTEEVVLVVRDYLELAGYKIVVANDGLDGLAQATLTRPDLILMDLQMPRMDGIEATRKLRSKPDFQYTPIIALTALAMPNDRERCLAAGMDEYISKPVNLRALLRIIQGFLSSMEEPGNG